MAEIVYSARSLANVQRAFDSLRGKSPAAAIAAAIAIRTAVEALALHPLIGRRIEGDLRELVISYGDSGYVAAYRYLVAGDEVRILAIRHQREIGYVP